jgi:hypothetical protein
MPRFLPERSHEPQSAVRETSRAFGSVHTASSPIRAREGRAALKVAVELVNLHVITAPRVHRTPVAQRYLDPQAVPLGRFDVFGVYCRNDLALSQAVTTLVASCPDDPRMGQMFRQLILVLFPDYPLFWQTRGPFFMR